MIKKREHLRIAYAIQNVGGIDFLNDLGDTVPVKHTLIGLSQAGHQVSCFMLNGRSVVGINDMTCLNNVWQAKLGLTGTRPFMQFESVVRRVQRELHLPYFAFFDTMRFHEACYRFLPNYNLCHEHNGLLYGGAALACLRLGKPYVLTQSADIFLERDQIGNPIRGIQRIIAVLEARFNYRIAKRIICVSESSKRHLIRFWHVDPEKIVVLPNGVDTNLFRPIDASREIRSKLELGDGPIIGFVGNFHPWHGLDLLVDSFIRIVSEFPTAKLLLIGDGRSRHIVDQKIEYYGVDSSVIVTGFISQKSVPEFLSVVDIAVLPYPKFSKELWFSPLKLYEYMATGKAIVASNDGQISQVISDGHNGLLVEPGSMNDLTHKLLYLIKHPEERLRFGKNARKQAIKQHSWSKYIQNLEAVYQSLL
jgi:glycosyltransferase involved in cell wall biosynthesis